MAIYMSELINLDNLLKNVETVSQDGTVNVYAVKNNHVRQRDIFSVAMPEDINENAIESICETLCKFHNAKCVDFDPINTIEETYELLPFEKIKTTWENIEKAINNSVGFKNKESKEKAKIANLLAVELTYNGIKYFLCSKQKPIIQLFKGKTAFCEANDKLKEIPIDNFYVLSFNIDFIVPCDKSGIFIFNKKNFISFFNYDEYLKENVEKRINIIDDWKFISSLDIVKECVSQKNVYKNLSKVFDDDEYLQQIKNIDSKTLKKRLLEKSEASFSEADFDKTKLKITKSNLDKVMKMLGKGFKYNFFSDKAEE